MNSSPPAPPRPTAAGRTTRPPLGPSWFAAVMGTGIVANAAVTLPWTFPGLRTGAMVIWLGAALLLVLLAAGYLRQRALRLHAGDPVMAQFLGAPPVALLTVGAGTLLLGRPLIGTEAALDQPSERTMHRASCSSRPATARRRAVRRFSYSR
ncbi:hypothetical protein AB0885_15375, partial [Streptomyces sp. NPDC005534]